MVCRIVSRKSLLALFGLTAAIAAVFATWHSGTATSTALVWNDNGTNRPIYSPSVGEAKTWHDSNSDTDYCFVSAVGVADGGTTCLYVAKCNPDGSVASEVYKPLTTYNENSEEYAVLDLGSRLTVDPSSGTVFVAVQQLDPNQSYALKDYVFKFSSSLSYQSAYELSSYTPNPRGSGAGSWRWQPRCWRALSYSGDYLYYAATETSTSGGTTTSDFVFAKIDPSNMTACSGFPLVQNLNQGSYVAGIVASGSNIYVGGSESTGGAGASKYVLVHATISGTPSIDWWHDNDPASSGSSTPVGIDIDSGSGYCVIAGSSNSLRSSFSLVAYNSSGTLQYSVLRDRHSGKNGFDDVACGMGCYGG